MSDPYSPISIGKPLFEYVNGDYLEWTVTDVHHRDDPEPHAILERDTEQATVGVWQLESAIYADDSRWTSGLYDGKDDTGDPQWIPHPRYKPDSVADFSDDHDPHLRVAPSNPSDLTVKKLTAKDSRKEINRFLEGADDDLVWHELGGIAKWKAAFAAYYRNAIVTVIVLHHYHPDTNGTELAITRLAHHPSAPNNTSSYMIGRARRYAERAGYERISAYTGVGDNTGTCYKAAGFDSEGTITERNSTDWDDDTNGTIDTWHRQKFVADLSPEKYADKDEQWAAKTAVDEIIEPEENTASLDRHLSLRGKQYPWRANDIGTQVTF